MDGSTFRSGWYHVVVFVDASFLPHFQRTANNLIAPPLAFEINLLDFYKFGTFFEQATDRRAVASSLYTCFIVVTFVPSFLLQ